MIDSIKFRASLGAGITLGNGVVVITPNGQHLVILYINFHSTKYMTEATEGFLGFDSLTHKGQPLE
jgi:hypothetical protein